MSLDDFLYRAVLTRVPGQLRANLRGQFLLRLYPAMPGFPERKRSIDEMLQWRDSLLYHRNTLQVIERRIQQDRFVGSGRLSFGPRRVIIAIAIKNALENRVPDVLRDCRNAGVIKGHRPRSRSARPARGASRHDQSSGTNGRTS